MLPFLVPFVGPVIDKLINLIPDSAAREKARIEAEAQITAQQNDLVKAFLQSDIAQAQINAKEAESSNLFVSGWRPGLGWICGASFAWVYVLQPLLVFVFNAIGHPVNLPILDFTGMSTVLLGMLGLSGMRTYEKKIGVQSNH